MNNDEHRDITQPLFEEVPDDVDETWRHIVLMGGMAMRDPTPSFLTAARTYRWAADVLAAAAIHDGELWRTTDPVLFLYRHALELYLKALMPKEWGHDLTAL